MHEKLRPPRAHESAETEDFARAEVEVDVAKESGIVFFARDAKAADGKERRDLAQGRRRALTARRGCRASTNAGCMDGGRGSFGKELGNFATDHMFDHERH